ncbi:glycosyltransferase family 2 protein [Flavobacterium sp. ZT3R18]|uniref:glycosyltransferase family 2 protein n=1 Tax=Flavobacterium sp. ZT3R18 TaxID=2594429 RepID=UPI001179F753|nr:glycosyltransferase family 2 protein [Flavobacterium sp. ZT3R18]TRX36789.1 glycosyltransferase family 2 protein [Flavobacterium sp. ZT3R18]
MQLSVIILNYNVRYFLELCVLSVESALENIDSEIIVIDNNSSDDSCEMMKTRFPNVKLIQNDQNVGFPKGNNIGVEHASGEYICILNPDTVVAEDTFEKVLAFAKKQIDLGIVGVKLIDGTGNFLPESKRGIPTPWVAFTKITSLYKLFPKSNRCNKYYAQHLDENQTGKVAILVGAFMFLKRELYNKVGGFDEDCFMYSDDIDLSYMVLQKGKTNYYFHETTVIHYKGESTIKDGTYMKRFQEAMEFFYRKHFKASFLFSVPMAIGVKIGIVFFSLTKRIQGRTKIKSIPKNYLLLSSSVTLAKIIAVGVQKKVDFLDWKTEKKVNLSSISIRNGAQIILDNEFVSFKECINIHERHRNKGITFKIMPKNANFIIGSDSSNDRGEVVKIK